MRVISIASLSLLLAACASTSAQRGSYATVIDPTHIQVMATDSLSELALLYPPATSRMEIDASAHGDGFGSALVSGLRQRGYAVVEYSGKRSEEVVALPLRYVVDQPIPGFYRVMLTVSSQSFSRGYTIVGTGVAPSTGWTLNLTGASPDLIERAMLSELPPAEEPAEASYTAAQVWEPSQAFYGEGRAYRPTRFKARRSGIARSWRVQFAAFRTDRVARQYWRKLSAKRPSLAKITPRFRRSSNGMIFVQSGPYKTAAMARAVCGRLKATGCIVVKA